MFGFPWCTRGLSSSIHLGGSGTGGGSKFGPTLKPLWCHSEMLVQPHSARVTLVVTNATKNQAAFERNRPLVCRARMATSLNIPQRPGFSPVSHSGIICGVPAVARNRFCCANSEVQHHEDHASSIFDQTGIN